MMRMPAPLLRTVRLTLRDIKRFTFCFSPSIYLLLWFHSLSNERPLSQAPNFGESGTQDIVIE